MSDSWFWLRSWSHSSWDKTPHQALGWQHGDCLGFSLPLSLSLPCAHEDSCSLTLSLSLSLSLKINKHFKKLKKEKKEPIERNEILNDFPVLVSNEESLSVAENKKQPVNLWLPYCILHDLVMHFMDIFTMVSSRTPCVSFEDLKTNLPSDNFSTFKLFHTVYQERQNVRTITFPRWFGTLFVVSMWCIFGRWAASQGQVSPQSS